MAILMRCLPVLLLALAGCGGSKTVALGGQRLPRLDIPPVLEYSAEENQALSEFSAAQPALARRIVNQSQSMRKSLALYDRLRWEHNAKSLRALGYTDEQIERLEGPRPE